MWSPAFGGDQAFGFILYSELLEIIDKVLKEKLNFRYYSISKQNPHFS